MFRIDLNCDLGEGFGRYALGQDEQIIPLITSANIACGFHASDPVIMEKTTELAKKAHVKIGAHPGYPDLMGFGRRNMKISRTEARDYIIYQIGALRAFCDACGVPLVHVKPHGAFYNMAAKDYDLACAICEGIEASDPKLKLLAPSGSCMEKAASDTGLSFIHEAFADRAYEEDGSLVSRTKEGAVLTDEKAIIARVIRMIREGKVKSVTGKDIPIKADSICVHGDTPGALLFAASLRKAFAENGIECG